MTRFGLSLLATLRPYRDSGLLRRLALLSMVWTLSLVPVGPAAAAGAILASPPSLCETAITTAEYTARLPARLLGAIAVVESGRVDSATGQIRPWPWTINAEGIGQFFATKAQAIAAVMALQARGVRSIDVGCMQVNLMFHPDAFANLDQAFEPTSNARYAARFLNALYADAHDWPRAIGAYHSQTPALGADYRVLVMDRWHQPYLARTELAHPAYQDFAAPQTAYNAFVSPDQIYAAFGSRRSR
ncbi:MAG: transglycosylase SLT domain-containing protein [Acetobacteraceae bacterium]|nr:transglycosylase SLT domain-containing protein [Acetobacteraceae bacterium]